MGACSTPLDTPVKMQPSIATSWEHFIPTGNLTLSKKEDGKEKRFRGVYSLDGDTLRICVTESDGWRATDLEAGPNRLLIVAKRVR